ncbi:MAG: SAP domain-containing protein [Gammaproteobacteria bacterium]|nr:SAP domain-containing protein [Gammaproteobacteria bacterium]
MKMPEVRSMAKVLGIKTGRMSKLKLIQAIQMREGNFPCFASALNGVCDQLACVWRSDCFIAAKK